MITPLFLHLLPFWATSVPERLGVHSCKLQRTLNGCERLGNVVPFQVQFINVLVLG